ncbi:MAG: rRNA (guanine966-N2)-methyltransferase [Actinomycetota bacterium]|nr:rRNA (guanine966-N2)-methyltransferase [Actinomycetota bacterium]
MTRIIAGTVGGRRLEVPRGDGTRPTSDRVREAVFSGLEARGALDGVRVLDLFAGSGALGLEAASRGARDVVLVDSARPAAAVARKNAGTLGLAGVTVVPSSVQRYLTRRPPWRAGLVFLDPPYALEDSVLREILANLSRGGWLAPGALVVVERSSRSGEPPWPVGLRRDSLRRYGETSVWTGIEVAGDGPMDETDPQWPSDPPGDSEPTRVPGTG